MRLFNRTPDKLPKEWNYESRTRTIKSLRIGESGFTLPWAMHQAHDGTCYLIGDFPVTSEPKGTSSLPIARSEDGMVVNLSAFRDPYWQGWQPGTIDSLDSIPVDRFV
jgi:hypothetical protein